LKVCREFDDVTSAGKLFHIRATATATVNARSPTLLDLGRGGREGECRGDPGENANEMRRRNGRGGGNRADTMQKS